MRRKLGASLWFALALALCACGKQQADETARTTSTPAAALRAPAGAQAPAATATERAQAGLAPAVPGATRRANEDGSETIEETTGDSGTHNALLAAVASTMAASMPSAAAATAWQEGLNYTRLVPAQPTAVPPGQVEVLEFFWYGCPHCYDLDPLVESWRKTKPAYIAFTRVPVMWSEAHRSTARLYYTVESLGKLDQMHGEIFREIHVKGDTLLAADPNDTAGAERIQGAFVGKFGISEDAFKKAYRSFSVETALQRADELVLRYRIEGVPTFIVNGKYLVDVRSAGSPEKLLSLVDDLAAQEHKH
jgi:thiol:disulfide interchange protein DsbA